MKWPIGAGDASSTLPQAGWSASGRRTGGHTPTGASVLATLAWWGPGSGGKYRVALGGRVTPSAPPPGSLLARTRGPASAWGVGDPQGRVSARHTTQDVVAGPDMPAGTAAPRRVAHPPRSRPSAIQPARQGKAVQTTSNVVWAVWFAITVTLCVAPSPCAVQLAAMSEIVTW